MSCRRLPHYRPGHSWMLGVTLPCTLTSTRPAFRGFTRVRCCSLPPASSAHPLTESAVAFGSQLPPTDPAGDFHPQSIIHVQRTRSAYGLAGRSSGQGDRKRETSEETTGEAPITYSNGKTRVSTAGSTWVQTPQRRRRLHKILDTSHCGGLDMAPDSTK